MFGIIAALCGSRTQRLRFFLLRQTALERSTSVLCRFLLRPSDPLYMFFNTRRTARIFVSGFSWTA